MRIVQFSAQERVDLPDMTAASFLMLGEFRRMTRALIVGEERNAIVRGYAVEADSPASALVLVKLEDGAEPLSLAILSEDMGAAVTYGQLVGDKNDDDDLEGNAETSLDFTGQPAATYTVQMRFVYADGATDNRAFWDDGTDEETIQSVSTRHLPAIELRLSGAPADDWIDLASVVWDGVSISSGDITDLREFLLEGGPATFTQTTQTGSGGMADFDRATTRAADGVNTLVPFMKALARQIQDIKGAGDDGTWSWFARPHTAYDPADALGVRTKSLRSIDTVSYTVGDGVISFGDFNGVTALQDCLLHIESITDADKPSRVEVVVHGGGSAYTITQEINITPASGHLMMIHIRGATNHERSGTGEGYYGRPQVNVTGATLGVNDYAILVSNSGGITIEDIDFEWTGTTASRGIIAAGGPIIARRCFLSQGASPDVDALFVLDSSAASSSHVEDCEIWGRVRFYDPGATGPAARTKGGTITNSKLMHSQVQLCNVAGIDADVAAGFTIRDCHITGRATARYTSSIAVVDARCAQYLTIEGCAIVYGDDENGIDGRTFSTYNLFKWRIADCVFENTISNGTHAVDSGNGGTAGTGWAINVERTAAGIGAVAVAGCFFAVNGVIDAGGVRFHNLSDVSAENDKWVNCGTTGGASQRFRGIQISASSANTKVRAKISDCAMHTWNNEETTGIYLENVDDVSITSSSFDGTDLASRANTECAIYCDDTYGVTILGCDFRDWSVSPVRTTVGANDYFLARGNRFQNCTSYAITATTTGSHISLTDNQVDASTANTQFGLLGGAASFVLINNNAIETFDATVVGIYIEVAAIGICVGNITNGDIQKAGAGVVRGHNEAGGSYADMNYVTGSYI